MMDTPVMVIGWRLAVCWLLLLEIAAPAREVIPWNDGWKTSRTMDAQAVTLDYPDATWETIVLPHDWSISGPFELTNTVPWGDFGKWVRWRKGGAQGYLPRGRAVYRKTFNALPEWAGQRVLVHFGGVYRACTVWLNGKQIGAQESGYVPFDLDLTPFLKIGARNVLAVTVDGSIKEEWWYQGIGIYRSVIVTVAAPLHVAPEGVWARVADIQPGRAVLDLQTDVIN